MNLAYVPLLQAQRSLHDLPRGRERFDAYRRLLRDGPDESRVRAPLLVVNPMAHGHVAARLDELLALEADAVAARTVADLAGDVADASGGDFRVALALADDAGGGWTNRYAWEFAHRFERPPAAQHGWLGAVLWAGDVPTTQNVRVALRTAVFREAFVQSRGVASTLRARLAQEGAVLARAGGTEPWLEPEELAYTRAVIYPHLGTTDLPTAAVCLFGDPAARSLGYEPLGLGHWAGLALAWHDARQNPG